MNWTNEKVLKYIEAYKDKDVLWNPAHKNYYNKNLKQEAWDELSVEMNCSVHELKKKMDYLLAALRREKAKIKKSNVPGVGPAEVYQSTWYPFKYMQFLFYRNKPRQRMNTEQEDQEMHNTRTPSIDTVSSAEQTVSNNTIDSSTSSLKHKLNKFMVCAEANDIRSASTTDFAKSSASKVVLASEASAVTELDEYQLYANYLAAKFRTYSKLTYIDIQHQINNLLYHSDCEQYDYRCGYSSNQRFSGYPRRDSPPPQIPTTVEDLVPEMNSSQESPSNYSFHQHVETIQRSP
ncbi:uncharacterized protein LOC131845679 [Achroia grisella]|uniref:uncharacterized protein LOC131845679 n=1 Tax=Achroia grisella TaxID=688607 RepID=UPI0027D2091B|nr:uncharacterized protein LOC131845679 [Achroia grisella]